MCVLVVRECRESVSDKPRKLKPATSVSDENTAKVRKLLTKDCRLTVRIIANELQINREYVEQIFTQNLVMRGTCCRLVSHHLTAQSEAHIFKKITGYCRNGGCNTN